MQVKKAVILAAGTGKRLDVFETPKPLVRVGGVSLIVRTLDSLKDAGVTNVIIIVRAGDKLIQKEVLDYPLDIEIVEKKEQSMLGSILALEGKIEGSFMVTMCDLVFQRSPYRRILRSSVRNLAVLVSAEKKDQEICGAQVRVAYDGQSIKYLKSDEAYNALEAGVYLFSEKGFSSFVQIAKRKRLKEVSEVFKEMSEKGMIKPILLPKSEWYDINEPSTLIRAELLLQKMRLKNGRSLKGKAGAFKKIKSSALLRHRESVNIDVVVKRGLLREIENYEVIPLEHFYSPHFLIVDKNLDKKYGEPLYRQFKSLGYKIHKIQVDPGEQSKSSDTYLAIANQILTAGVDKKSIVIALGGGVVKDLSGFLASTIYRGIGFISIPTTVLSQCDAAIGLKQGINGQKGKNLLGSWYAPSHVFVDPAVLKTLDSRYIHDGLAECLKLGFAADKKYFAFLDKYEGSVSDIDFLEKAVAWSIRLKLKGIQADYREENVSLVNLYGHEVGHAIEFLSGYTLGHGEAVAVGMRVSAELAHLMRVSKKGVREAHVRLLKKYDLPYTVPKAIRSGDIARVLRYDKKYHGGEARFVLVDKIGSIWRDKKYYSVQVSDELVKAAVAESYGDIPDHSASS